MILSEAINIRRGTTAVTAVYRGSTLVWPTNWTPRQLFPEVWYDAADATTITLNGSNVSQWNDKSGKNRHAIQGNASEQPLYVSKVSNGLPALQTDGNDFLSIQNTGGLLQNVGNATVAIVVKYVTANYVNNSASVFVSAGSSSSLHRFTLTPAPTASNTRLGLLGRRSDNDAVVTLNSSTTRASVLNSVAIQIGNIIYSSAIANHFTNGTQDLAGASFPVTSGAGNTSNTTPSAGLFRNFSSASGQQLPSGCQLFEVLIFNSTLSTSDRQKLEGYLAWKWGSVATLPAGHPFKNSPPYIT